MSVLFTALPPFTVTGVKLTPSIYYLGTPCLHVNEEQRITSFAAYEGFHTSIGQKAKSLPANGMIANEFSDAWQYKKQNLRLNIFASRGLTERIHISWLLLLLVSFF